MGWEMRGTCGPYYYAKQRHGGRVVSRYMGRGAAAEGVAAMIDMDKWMRDRERSKQRREVADLDDRTAAAAAALAALTEATNAAIREALTAAGYHQHKRGEWRRRRGA